MERSGHPMHYNQRVIGKLKDARFQRNPYNTASNTCYKRNTYANNTSLILKI